jgi:hypothetical protein
VHSIDIGQNCRGNPPLICLSATQAWVLGRNPAEDAGARRCGAFSAELGYPVGGRWEESRRARLSQVDEATETDLWYWRCYVDWKLKVTLLVIIKLACSAVQRSMRAFPQPRHDWPAVRYANTFAEMADEALFYESIFI